MAKAGNLLSARNIIPIPSPQPVGQAKSFKVLGQASKNGDSSRKQNPQPLIRKKGYRAPRRLISISTSHGAWQNKWTTDHVCSLQELQLDDLVKDDQKDVKVLITLSIQEHAAYGFSVDGKIVTSLTRTCSNCFSSYCKEIDTGFHVWILPSPRIKHEDQLPEIGGDDPSVIYVKPGREADLDSVVQDTIRLTMSVQDTCSDSCEKSEPEVVYFGQEHTDTAEKRWPQLLELKKRIQNSSP